MNRFIGQVRCMGTFGSSVRRANMQITKKHGKDVLKDSTLNKGTGFKHDERERLGLRGLLPHRQFEMHHQADRFLAYYNQEDSDIRRFNSLQALQDRNETLFYKVVINNIKSMAPIVYTPTVGKACQEFSTSFREARGLYVSLEDTNDCLPIMYNWKQNEVDVIVVTDGSRVLGLGDLGVHGMGISIGKLVLYTAAGGIHPRKALPITIDVGTNNKELQSSPMYLGSQKPRCGDKDYFELMDAFMEAVYTRWPNVLVQFEDFENVRAGALLDRYRHKYLCFNDDIQGTGAVALAGILCSLRARGKTFNDLVNERILVVGAGSAGMGVANTILSYAEEMCGLTKNEARRLFWVTDNMGLLSEKRLSNKGALLPHHETYLRPETHLEGASILEVVKEVKPTILLGLSGVGGIFSHEVCAEMGKVNDSPVIFAMSNPSNHAECSSEQVFAATEGKAIFASGSPFEDVVTKDGKLCKSNQGNNMYIFPGIGLGVVVAGCNLVTNGMILCAAEALASSMEQSELDIGMVYPNIENIRQVSLCVATAIIEQALKEGVVTNPKKFKGKSTEEIRAIVKEHMFQPEYSNLIYQP